MGTGAALVQQMGSKLGHHTCVPMIDPRRETVRKQENPMSDVLQAVPNTDTIKTGVVHTTAIAKGLSESLADTYRLLFKTHAYHWNVEGPMFHSIHILTEGQYEDLFAAADVVAERIRALGKLTPSRMDEIVSMSCVKDSKSLPSAKTMVEELAADHEAVSKRMHGVIKDAENGNDPVTADLLTARCAFHEKAAWMLRAMAK
jgi:starvation-inducible DNA-binding protein